MKTWGSATDSEKSGSIETFFNGKSVFITGGSGFLGKTLTEKLLRSCPGVQAVYLLIRKKKGKNVEQRLSEIFDDVIYKEVKERNPKLLDKVFAISGDCSLPGMGISKDDRKLLIENVNVVFHVAATLRFDENLKIAIIINVVATQEVINMCHSMEKLDSLVYVSTAYSNCYAENITEEVSEWSPSYEEVLRLAETLTEKEIKDKTRSLLGKWPNTYTFTKAFAEALVKKSEGQLPACIFRPGIVISTYSEPCPGWVGNILGPTGLVLGASCGVVRVIRCNTDIEANVVPADFVINGMLASANETHKNFREFRDYMQKYGLSIPTVRAVWYYFLIMCKSRYLTYLLCVLLHWLPAVVIDTAAVLSGRKPGMMRLYQRVHKVIKAVGYFSTRRWIFDTHNVQSLWEKTTEEDKKIFNFDITTVSWNTYFKWYITGIRTYVLKEDMNNLEEARKKWNRLYWWHQMLKMIVVLLGLSTVWYMICKLAKLIV